MYPPRPSHRLTRHGAGSGQSDVPCTQDRMILPYATSGHILRQSSVFGQDMGLVRRRRVSTVLNATAHPSAFRPRAREERVQTRPKRRRPHGSRVRIRGRPNGRWPYCSDSSFCASGGDLIYLFTGATSKGHDRRIVANAVDARREDGTGGGGGGASSPSLLGCLSDVSFIGSARVSEPCCDTMRT